MRCLLLVLALAAAGCKTPVMKGEAKDAALLREPKQAAAPPADAAVFPAAPGTVWEFRTVNPRTKAAYTEQLAVEGKRTIGGKTGQVFTWRRNGKAYQQSVYRVTREGLEQLSVGENGAITLSPPLPVLTFPGKEGSLHLWSGTIRSGKQTQPAEVTVRLTRREKIKVPAGVFEAYRVDTVLRPLRQSNAPPIRAAAWYAPKVGMVRQVTQEGDAVLVRELTRGPLR